MQVKSSIFLWIIVCLLIIYLWFKYLSSLEYLKNDLKVGIKSMNSFKISEFIPQ